MKKSLLLPSVIKLIQMNLPEFDFPIRKSPRADFHDYGEGCYFITICTEGKRHYFGEIRNGEMFLSEIGRYATFRLESINEHHPYAIVQISVVMPNHIHAIIYISPNLNGGRITFRDPNMAYPLKRSPLAVIIGNYKQSVTMFAKKHNIEFGWQRSYHDHIIRGANDGNNIAAYIENNVSKWADDCFH